MVNSKRQEQVQPDNDYNDGFDNDDKKEEEEVS